MEKSAVTSRATSWTPGRKLNSCADDVPQWTSGMEVAESGQYEWRSRCNRASGADDCPATNQADAGAVRGHEGAGSAPSAANCLLARGWRERRAGL